jgi:hypothetical protein
VPEPKESVPPIPVTATEVPDLSKIQLLDPKETIQPTPATATELPELPPIQLPEPKETVQLIPPATSHAPAPPGIFAEEPKPPARPIPAATDRAPATPKIPEPTPTQPSKPMSPSAGHAPTQPQIPVPEPRQPVRPMPPAAAQAPAVKGTVQAPRPTAKAIPPTAPRVPAPTDAQGVDSDSLDFTKVITIKNPFGGGRVHVKELETMDVRAAATPRAKGEVNEVEFINNLKEGMWVEFRETVAEDANQLAKLSYISPLRSSFLFVDQQGKTVKECTRTELGRLVRLGMVVVVVVEDEAPLFDRMMAGVIGKLS